MQGTHDPTGVQPGTTETALDLLLVEDDPTDARLLGQLLDHAAVGDATLQVAQTLADAERLLVTRHFDAVLLDLSLPDCDGLTSVHRLLEVAGTVPIVVLTGRDDVDLGLRSIEAGAQDFLVKGEVKGNTILRCVTWAMARLSGRGGRGGDRWAVLDRTVAGVAVVDHDLRVVTANPAFEVLCGRDEAELARVPLTDLVEVEDIVAFVLDLRATMRGEIPVQLLPVDMVTPSGSRAARCAVARVEPLDPSGDEMPSLLLTVLGT